MYKALQRHGFIHFIQQTSVGTSSRIKDELGMIKRAPQEETTLPPLNVREA